MEQAQVSHSEEKEYFFVVKAKQERKRFEQLLPQLSCIQSPEQTKIPEEIFSMKNVGLSSTKSQFFPLYKVTILNVERKSKNISIS